MSEQKPSGCQGVSLAPGSIIQIGEKDGWRTANGPDAGTFTPYTEQERQALEGTHHGNQRKATQLENSKGQ